MKLRTLLLLFPMLALALSAADAPRERSSFNTSWRFQKGDPAGVGDQLAYAKIKSWVVATGNDLLSPTVPAPARPAFRGSLYRKR